jgi:hypothetical protein
MVHPGVVQSPDDSAVGRVRSPADDDEPPGQPADTGAPTGTPRPGPGRLAVDLAVLLGLAGAAITQPLLDLLGRNPTFFVAGHYETSQIVLFGLIVALVPALVVFVLTSLPGLALPRVQPWLHGVGVGLLAALFGLVLLQDMRLDGVIYVIPLVLAVGAVVAVAEARSRLARQFLALLAAGNLAFLLMFLVASPTAELLRTPPASGQQGEVAVPPLTGPVLVMVLDEFPVTSIMRSDGTVNDTRYPNIARLAEASTWFRNAASESRTTYVSTPSILSGARAADDDLPILADHPRNLFSLFGARYPVNRYELVTDMCPEDACDPPPPQSMRQLVDDASVVYRHQALPPDLREGLPPVDAGWGNFANAIDGGPGAGELGSTPPTTIDTNPMQVADDIPDEERGVQGQVAAFRRQIAMIDAEPSLNFLHVAIPHHPYVLTPWGEGSLPATRLPDEISGEGNQLPPVDDPAYDFEFRQLYAMQSMQLGAVDRLLGETIDHLESTGAWDDALVVVMSDHGIDMTSPGFTRREDDTNVDELFRIPLFIKAPGQAEGAIDDAPASTVDVLPSIIDLLGIEADWELEGHSLFDGSEPGFDRHVPGGLDDALAVARAHEEQFPRGEDWVALAAVGEGEDLVGDAVDDHEVGPRSDLSWTLDDGDGLDDLSLAEDRVPYILEGAVTGADERPPELVVAINGTIAGTIGGYRAAGDDWHFTGYMAPFFEDGANEVVAYEVRRDGDAVTLLPVGD